MPRRTDRPDRAPLPRGEVGGQQGLGRRRRPTPAQAHHLAVDDSGEHRPELLPFAMLNLVEADVPRLPRQPCPVPLGETSLFGPARLAPAHAMTHRRVAGRHRLTVHADLLAQAARHPRLGLGKRHPLGPNPEAPADHAARRVDERDGMGRPGQVVRGPIPRRAHPARAMAAPAAGVAPIASALEPNDEPAVVGRVHRHPETRQAPQNPRTIAARSHRSSLVGCTSRENTIHSRMARTWDRLALQAAEQTAPPSAVRAGGRVSPGAVIKSVNRHFLVSGLYSSQAESTPAHSRCSSLRACMTNEHINRQI